MPATQHRRVFTVGYAIVCAVTIGYILFLLSRWVHSVPGDFNDFYSGGQVVRGHGNPYLVQPLLHDELFYAAKGAVIAGPVPLPPYDLFFLAGLAKLNIRAALFVMAVSLAFATFFTAFVVSRMARLPLSVAFAVVSIGTLYQAIALGQIAPIAMAGIAIAAWAVREQRFTLASIALLIGAIEPHMAAFSIVTAFIILPRMRVPLIVGAAILLAIGFVALGGNAWAGYLQTVKLQALAEVHFPAQYSLTWLLAATGVSDDAAVLGGSLWMLILLVVGIVVVRVYRDPMIASGAVILFPATLALLGGAFVHVQQIAFALVPALIFVRPGRRIVDYCWVIALFVLPFDFLYTNLASWPTSAAWFSIGIDTVVAWTALYCLNRQFGMQFATKKASVITASLFAALVVMIRVHRSLRFLPRSLKEVRFAPMENASIPWRILCDDLAHSFQNIPYLIIAKSIIWVAVALTAVLILRTIASHQGETAVAAPDQL